MKKHINDIVILRRRVGINRWSTLAWVLGKRFSYETTTPHPKSKSSWHTLTNRPGCKKGKTYEGCVMTVCTSVRSVSSWCLTS